MRQMPHGQWVAFDGAESVHECGQKSEYELDPTTSQQGGFSAHVPTTPRPAAQEPRTPQTTANEPYASNQPRTPAKKQEGWPGWIWWVIGAIVLYFLMKR